MRNGIMKAFSILCLMLCQSAAVSANEIKTANERKEMLAYGFIVPAGIIFITVFSLILYECIRRKKENRDKLF